MKSVEVNGQVCKFDPDDHKYLVDGETVPGTTSITGIIDKSTPLMWWVANEARSYIKDNLTPGESLDEVEIDELAEGARLAHKRSSSKALSIGTVVHKYAEDWIKSKLMGGSEPDFPENEEAQESAIEFLDWAERSDIIWLGSEQMVYHPEHRYAGTYDAIARIDGDLYIIDFKTSKSIYKEYYLQAVAYMKAQQVSTDRYIDGIAICRFPKNSAGFEVEKITDDDEIERHWQGFLGALQVYRWKNS